MPRSKFVNERAAVETGDAEMDSSDRSDPDPREESHDLSHRSRRSRRREKSRVPQEELDENDEIIKDVFNINSQLCNQISDRHRDYANILIKVDRLNELYRENKRSTRVEVPGFHSANTNLSEAEWNRVKFAISGDPKYFVSFPPLFFCTRHNAA